MGYINDISKKLNEMHDKKLHEEFNELTERLVDTNSLDMLPVLYRIIDRYDKVCRVKAGLQLTVENIRRKEEMVKNAIYYEGIKSRGGRE